MKKGPMKRWTAVPEGALPAGRVREVVGRIRRRSDAFGRIVGREGAVRGIGTGRFAALPYAGMPPFQLKTIPDKACLSEI